MAWQVLNAINDGDLDTLIRISMNVRGVPRIALLLCSNPICAFLFRTETPLARHTNLSFCRAALVRADRQRGCCDWPL